MTGSLLPIAAQLASYEVNLMLGEPQRSPLDVLFCLSVSALLRNGTEEAPAFRSNTPARLPGRSFGDLLQHLRSHFGLLHEELQNCRWLAFGAAEYAHIDPTNTARCCKSLRGFQVYESVAQLAPVITKATQHGFSLAWDDHVDPRGDDNVKPESLPVIALYIERRDSPLGVVSCWPCVASCDAKNETSFLSPGTLPVTMLLEHFTSRSTLLPAKRKYHCLQHIWHEYTVVRIIA
jgi:hypothetical protein